MLFRFRAEVVLTLQVSKTLEKEKKGCVQLFKFLRCLDNQRKLHLDYQNCHAFMNERPCISAHRKQANTLETRESRLNEAWLFMQFYIRSKTKITLLIPRGYSFLKLSNNNQN